MKLRDVASKLTAMVILLLGACSVALGASSLDMPGVTAAGLGGAGTALQSDTSLLINNPAGLSALAVNQVAAEATFTDSQRAYRVSLLSKNQNKVSGGLYIMSLTEQTGAPYYDVGYAVALGPWSGASVGTTIHYLRDGTGAEELAGWSVDAGVQQSLGLVKVGASVRNAWSGGAGVSDLRFPQEIRAGVAVGGAALLLAVDAVKTSDEDELIYAGGLSYQAWRLAISGGITKDGNSLKYSAGLRMPVKSTLLALAAQWDDKQAVSAQVGWAYLY